jgi:hypothetical protein
MRLPPSALPSSTIFAEVTARIGREDVHGEAEVSEDRVDRRRLT